jgi:pimeloyl-ACP methyl ester carboxylesterase
MPTLSIADLSLHYIEAGTGTPILFIHGHPFDCISWAPQLADFPGFHFIAPDLRNFGQTTSPNPPTDFSTYARDLIAFADALALDKFLVAGLSMGGQIALELAALCPERLLGLILCDTFAQLDTPEKKANRYALADRLGREGMDAYALEVLPRMFCAETVANNPGLCDALVAMMRRAPAHGASAALHTRAERQDYLPLLPTLDLPTLILVGEYDAFTPVADAQLMHTHIRNSTLVVIRDAGHIANLEQPAAFNRALADFLHSLPAHP